MRLSSYLLIIFVSIATCELYDQSGFVRVDSTGRYFELDGSRYTYVGANYWYGVNLANPNPDKGGNVTRLRNELDQLVSMGVKNLRIMAGSQGDASNHKRISPSLQPAKGEYDEDLWIGFDVFLDEMAKRDMKAVVPMSNFWEWSGGFGVLQSWAHGTGYGYPTNFYDDTDAKELYYQFLRDCINRVNSVNGRRYGDDPTIMAWQLANEPRAGSCGSWRKWIESSCDVIRSLTMEQLISVGNEGSITGCKNEPFTIDQIDYITFHMWAQNWGWYRGSGPIDQAFPRADGYLTTNIDNNKPTVLEEFGLARDGGSYEADSPTTIRDDYYAHVFEKVYQEAKAGSSLSGVNFWAYGGEGRPRQPGGMWQPGDDLIGDPPHERQGWYSVWDTDKSTHAVIKKYADLMDGLEVMIEVEDDLS